MDSRELAANPILLVEDNEANQKIAIILLRRLGLSADIASDGKEALDKLSKYKYKLILMDCQMPVMDGFETARSTRKIEAAQGIYTPIIAITALAMPGDRERCLAAGMDDYISKPISRDELDSKIKYWLSEQVYNGLQSQQADQCDLSPINLAPLSSFDEAERIKVVDLFFSDGQILLRQINQGLERRDAQFINGKAEILRSSAKAIGAKALHDVAQALEIAVNKSDFALASEEVKNLEACFEVCRQYYLISRD